MAEHEIPPSREEWMEWSTHPTTRWFKWALTQVRQEVQDSLSTGATLRQASDDTAQATARAVGYVSGVGVALDLEPEVMEATS